MNDNELSLSVWFKLLESCHRMGRAGAALIQAYDITPPQFLVLLSIQEQALTQQQLAEALLVTKGNISQIVKVMERNDLIVRQQKGTANKLYLTEKAHDILAQVQPAHAAFVGRCLGALKPDELRQLEQLLAKIQVP